MSLIQILTFELLPALFSTECCGSIKNDQIGDFQSMMMHWHHFCCILALFVLHSLLMDNNIFPFIFHITNYNFEKVIVAYFLSFHAYFHKNVTSMEK